MKSDSELLEEVVVTGYGTFKKASFTGAASTVNTSTLEDVPVLSVADKLSGNVAGVTFGSSSSNPGSVSSIRVRGMGSINAGNNPLYVIDGTPVTSGNLSEFTYSDAGTDILSSLNTNDIESITVIKDAAAASLYGSRAANGVVVITTKSGKQGKTNVSFRSDWGFSNMAIDYRPMLDGDSRRDLLWTGLKNYGLYTGNMSDADAATFADQNIEDFASKPSTGWTDWKDLLFRNGSHQNYQLSVSGGNDRTKFYTSVAYTNQEGIIYKQGLERFTGNANLTHKFGDFEVQVTSQFSKVRQNKTNEATSYDGPVANYAFFQSPSSTPYNEDGTLNNGCGVFGVNPLYEREHSSDVYTLMKAFNTIKLTYNIWDKLNLSEKIAYDYAQGTNDVLWDRHSNNGAPGGVMQRIVNRNDQLNTQTQLSYINSFGLHNIDALLGFETQDTEYAFNYMAGQDYPGDLYELTNAGSTSAETNRQSYRMTSFLGRANYNYADRYYLGLSYRTDGSSRLARENRWGSFWSVSGAWRFIDESFLNPVKSVLTDGKLRVSYGVNGTQPSDYYAYMNLYKYGIIYNGQSGMSIVGIANPDLKWEKTGQWDLGFELGLFNNRLNFDISYYYKYTSDLLLDRPVPESTGYSSIMDNIGAVSNRGLDILVTAYPIQTHDFQWTSTLNLGFNKNRVEKLDESASVDPVTGKRQITTDGFVGYDMLIREGEELSSFYGYKRAGIYDGIPSNWDPETMNIPSTIGEKVTYKKREIIGNGLPDWMGSFINTFNYKGFDLTLDFQFTWGVDVMQEYYHSTVARFLTNGIDRLYKEAWHPTLNPSGKEQAIRLNNFGQGANNQADDDWVCNGSYLRCNMIQLGYTFNPTLIKKIGLSSLRLYANVNNAFLITSKDYNGYDPDNSSRLGDNKWGANRQFFTYPRPRTFTFGLNVAF